MRPYYACTGVSIHREDDDWEDGLTGGGDDEYRRCRVSSDTLAGLVQALGLEFGLSMDEVIIAPQDDGSEVVYYLDFSREENEEGLPPTESEWVGWKAGKRLLWCVTYRFAVEHRTVRGLTRQECEEAGIALG